MKKVANHKVFQKLPGGIVEQLLALLALVLLLSIIGTVLVTALAHPAMSALNNPSLIAVVSPTPTPTPPPPPELSIVLLGYGGASHDGGALTDTIMVARIHPIDKTITLISVPRDLWVPISLSASSSASWGKINSAYAIGLDEQKYPFRDEKYQGNNGGGTLTKEIVETVTGIHPTYYAAVNFDAFVHAIDTLGPLTVNVPYTFDDFLYPIKGMERESCGLSEVEIADLTARLKDLNLEKNFMCRYEQLHFDKGPMVMDGATALKFVRSRHSAVGGSDFGRSERQQALITAAKQRIFSLSFLPKIMPLGETLLKSVQTDFSASDLPNLLAKFRDIQDYKITSITLTDANVLQNGKSRDRQYILMPRAGEGNWTGIQAFINESIKQATASAELTASDSATATATSSSIKR